MQEEFRVEREEMLEELRDLEKHLKLDDTIIQHFVPSEAVDMIQKRATWDEQLDNWVLAPRTPTSDLSQLAVRGSVLTEWLYLQWLRRTPTVSRCWSRVRVAQLATGHGRCASTRGLRQRPPSTFSVLL